MKGWYSYVKKIHLYACLTTVSIFLMFIVTSFMMIHHSSFPRENTTQKIELITTPDQLSEQNIWSLLDRYNVKGRVMNKQENDKGEWTIKFVNSKSNTTVTASTDRTLLTIEEQRKDAAHAFMDIHRQRGYGGPLAFNIYAVLLDVMGVSLILFAVTGLVMWFKILKFNRLAWVIFIAGAVYFFGIMAALVF